MLNDLAGKLLFYFVRFILRLAAWCSIRLSRSVYYTDWERSLEWQDVAASILTAMGENPARAYGMTDEVYASAERFAAQQQVQSETGVPAWLLSLDNDWVHEDYSDVLNWLDEDDHE